MRCLRVLYFIGSREQGGSERQVAELVRNLPRDRVEPHLAVCNVADDFGYLDGDVAHVHDLRSPRGPSASTFLPLVRVVRSIKPDIVHAIHDPQNTYARLAVRVARSGVAIGSLRSTALPLRTLRRERVTHRLGAALIVNSEEIRRELARAGIARVDVVENGVDVARFAPLDVAGRRDARVNLGLAGDTFVLAARVTEQKNQLTVVRAVAALRARGLWPPSARVVFAGRAAHPRYADEVDHAIRMLRVADAVRRIPPLRDVERLLAAADAVLLPSHFEGLPNVVLESLACGTPPIVSPAANSSLLVRDGSTGFVLDGVNVEAVGQGLLRFLAASAKERLTMGRQGREEVRARFGIARMVDATCAIYDRVTRRAPRRVAA